MNTIFSKTNEKVKFIRSLNEKKFRIKNNAFYLEGVKVVNEILDKAIDIMFIAYSKSILTNTNGGDTLLNRIEKLENIEVIDFEENIFKYMTDTVNPQGILAVLKIPNYDISTLIKRNNKNIVVLDKVQDLGNIGTIIRSCNAFDIDLIICTQGTVDVYSPKALRATMGGILNCNIVYVNNNDILKLLKENGYSLVTTSLDSTNSIEVLDYSQKYAFIMGNEANGVSDELQDLSNISVKIPMSDKIESLNVGVATSIILYEQYKNKTSRD